MSLPSQASNEIGYYMKAEIIVTDIYCPSPPKESIWYRLCSSETEIKIEGDDGTHSLSGCLCKMGPLMD